MIREYLKFMSTSFLIIGMFALCLYIVFLSIEFNVYLGIFLLLFITLTIAFITRKIFVDSYV